MSAPQKTEDRPMIELQDSGLLWLINRVVFHPRGLTLALHTNVSNEVTGWSLYASPDGAPWKFTQDEDRDNHHLVEEAMANAVRA